MIVQLNQKFEHLFSVDAHVYEGFIAIFNDHNSLHTDEVFAKEKGFKTKVMHGNILNGFISYFIGELLPSEKVMILSQNINYRKPVYLNDRLLFEAVVVEQSESVMVNTFSFKFRNEEKELVASGKILIKELE